MKYDYQAMDPTGEIVKDSLEAPSYDDAVRKVREKGLFVTKVIPQEITEEQIVFSMLARSQQRAEELEKKARTARIRLKISIGVMLIAFGNCAASLYGQFIGNPWYSIIGLPISAIIVTYAIWNIRQSRKSIKESKEVIKEIENEHATSTSTP